MILRLSDSLARALIVLAALLTGVWLSFFAIRSAVARYGADGQTARRLELAVRLEPDNPEYWYALGRYQEYNLEQANSVLAENSFRVGDRAKSQRHRRVVGSRHGSGTGWKA